MNLKLPFFNRKRYIVMKCYTDNKRLYEYAPILRSSLLPAPECQTDKHPVKQDNFDRMPSFRTCFGRVEALKTSAAIPLWNTMHIKVDNDLNISVDSSDMQNLLGYLDFDHNNDPYYDTENFYVVKHVCAWHCEETTGVKFVSAQHIQNNTNMRIPSGIIDFKHQHAMNVFNLVSKYPHSYTIPFKTPTIALYPLSDLPLHVESYFDTQKAIDLDRANSSRFWNTGTALKLSRIKT